MTYAELPLEERLSLSEKIKKIIGTKDSWITESMDLSTKITQRSKYDKTFEKLAKVFLKYGDKGLSMNFTDNGSYKEGVTVSGKKWILYMNNGFTNRSWTCGSLFIEGEGNIFTSGTIERSFEYIFTH